MNNDVLSNNSILSIAADEAVSSRYENLILYAGILIYFRISMSAFELLGSITLNYHSAED